MNYKNKMYIEQNREVQLITDNVNVACNHCVLCNLCNHLWLLCKRPLVLQYIESGCSDTLSHLPVRKLSLWKIHFLLGLVLANMGEENIYY